VTVLTPAFRKELHRRGLLLLGAERWVDCQNPTRERKRVVATLRCLALKSPVTGGGYRDARGEP
jgi:hypothetical protein